MSRMTLQKNSVAAVRRHVASAFREILSDPDRGAILRSSFVHRLQKSLRSAAHGKHRDLRTFLKK